MALRAIATVLPLLMCSAPAAAQPLPSRPSFEVASIKPAPPPVNGADYRMRGGPGTSDPGQISCPRVGMLDLLMKAYGVRMDQVSGPDWIHTEVYSISAKVPPNTTRDQFNLMLQNLLAERFHLKLHHESREFPVYWLLVAKGGPKLTASSPDAARKGFPVLAPGAKVATATGTGPLYGTVRSTHRQTMAEFADGLGAMVNMSNGDGIARGSPPPAHVFDKTGLSGEFEFTLEFAGSVLPGGANDSLAPSLFVALEKQLGLKLESGRAALDVLMIDQADKLPTEN